jgi:hypothetical protein
MWTALNSRLARRESGRKVAAPVSRTILPVQAHARSRLFSRTVTPSYVSTTISGTLISTVRKLYDLGCRQALTGRVLREGTNNYTDFALAAYVTAVAAVEAFVNESLLADVVEWMTRGSPIWRLRRDWLEKLELRDKMILTTQLLFGHALDPSRQPLQDFVLLLKVRNQVVHYKTGAPPRFLNEFVTRDIALGSQTKKAHPELAHVFAWDMGCTEGIRWAHNTSCRMVHELVASIPIDETVYLERAATSITEIENFRFLHASAAGSASNFFEITDADARGMYSALGLNPDGSDP